MAHFRVYCTKSGAEITHVALIKASSSSDLRKFFIVYLIIFYHTSFLAASPV